MKTLRTNQGQAWDQLALAEYGSEKRMGLLPPANVENADALLFEGNLAVNMPEAAPVRVKSLPPWEKMK